MSVSTRCKWRQHDQQRSEPTILLPIAVEPAIQAPHLSSKLPANAALSPEVPPASSGMIAITLQQANIRINGLIKATTLRVVLERLQGC